MAKKSRKIPKGKSSRALRRLPETLNMNDRILIVCEGKKTEPAYFKKLVVAYRVPTAKIKILGDGGSAPISVVEHAESTRDEDPEFEKIFVVFDRDRHESYSRAIEKCRTFAEKCLASGTSIKVITSVPCFEYWLLLHVEETNRPYGETSVSGSPADQLIRDLKKHDVFSGYSKADCSFFKQIFHKIDGAGKRAMRFLGQAHQDGSIQHHENPSTRVHYIVEELARLSTK